jgi:hypothetical protein
MTVRDVMGSLLETNVLVFLFQSLWSLTVLGPE